MTYYDTEFFLEFSSKEEYLYKRSLWRETYKNLSLEIRHNKNVSKITHRNYSKSFEEACKIYANNVRDWNFYLKIDEIMNDPLPESGVIKRSELPKSKNEYTKYYDATELLEIRHEQKKLSKEQREQALNNIFVA